uniref:Uncharacterized protein n=1 Tax=Pristionchus pacificus TaxID=54126 RepID=A0A2A6CPZ1_PRIPA|eukprot:PDM80209.1 hypothetical protein PRIPAC_32788 [Pristionchus pacificus]
MTPFALGSAEVGNRPGNRPGIPGSGVLVGMHAHAADDATAMRSAVCSENMSEVPRHVMNVTSTPANCHVAPFAEHSSSIVTFPSGTPSPESLTCSPSLNCKRGQIILEI